ncbi:MAG: hypothetical protein LBK73_12230 [Treponema sp.]|jgi:hypothetical protein|nr:hypothetical protein [Treponema sp.]
MKDNMQAFPVFDSARTGTDYVCSDPGMTIREYAAIKLKVPRSGDDAELDALIRESRRADFAGQAIIGISHAYFSTEFNNGMAKADISEIAHCAYLVADRMIEELEKERGVTND